MVSSRTRFDTGQLPNPLRLCGGYPTVSCRDITPAKNELSPSFTKTFRRPSQNSLSALSLFPAFWQRCRPPVLMHHLSYRLLWAAPKVHIHERRMKKQIHLFLTSFFHVWMLRICPQCNVTDSGGAFVPLRGGFSENALPKGRKATADISDNARAAYL